MRPELGAALASCRGAFIAIGLVSGLSNVLMLTGSNARDDVDRARQAGAAGYVTKDRIAAELIDAIVEVASR